MCKCDLDDAFPGLPHPHLPVSIFYHCMATLYIVLVVCKIVFLFCKPSVVGCQLTTETRRVREYIPTVLRCMPSLFTSLHQTSRCVICFPLVLIDFFFSFLSLHFSFCKLLCRQFAWTSLSFPKAVKHPTVRSVKINPTCVPLFFFHPTTP